VKEKTAALPKRVTPYNKSSHLNTTLKANTYKKASVIFDSSTPVSDEPLMEKKFYEVTHIDNDYECGEDLFYVTEFEEESIKRNKFSSKPRRL
jgi:hypothetical protein